ncbi:MAG: hypothetical protein ACTSRZ_02145 [Promethearchaeota archaeon]
MNKKFRYFEIVLLSIFCIIGVITIKLDLLNKNFIVVNPKTVDFNQTLFLTERLTPPFLYTQSFYLILYLSFGIFLLVIQGRLDEPIKRLKGKLLALSIILIPLNYIISFSLRRYYVEVEMVPFVLRITINIIASILLISSKIIGRKKDQKPVNYIDQGT